MKSDIIVAAGQVGAEALSLAAGVFSIGFDRRKRFGLFLFKAVRMLNLKS
jgi:hypothetical protein